VTSIRPGGAEAQAGQKAPLKKTKRARERGGTKRARARERARTWGWGRGLQEEVGQVKLKRIREPFDVFAQEIESVCLWCFVATEPTRHTTHDTPHARTHTHTHDTHRGQWLVIDTQLATATSIDKFDGVLCRSGRVRGEIALEGVHEGLLGDDAQALGDVAVLRPVLVSGRRRSSCIVLSRM
jgi:hypothetical protein